MPMPALRNHATALAKMATLTKMPLITTVSVPQGPTGPLIPEIHQIAPMRNTLRERARSMPGIIPSEDAQEWAKLYTLIFPPYQLLIESYGKAQEVVANKERLDSARA